MKDQIYSKRRGKISPFVFDHRVANVFEDMINRSVPGYSDIVGMCGALALQYVKPHTRVYDLGCSLGAASQAVLNAIPGRACELIAVDSSAAMLESARKKLKVRSPARVIFRQTLLEKEPIHQASFVLLNFVLQFIEKKRRLEILRKIYTGLIPGGALVFSEKIEFKTKRESDTQRKLHEKFKRLQGYSDLEISQKRTALEKVLIPETLQVHEKRLRQAGFSQVYVWFRCFNFMSLLAIK